MDKPPISPRKVVAEYVKSARARQLGHRLVPVSAVLFAEPNPVVIKAVLHAEGMIPSPMVRLPLLQASRESLSAALDVLRG